VESSEGGPPEAAFHWAGDIPYLRDRLIPVDLIIGQFRRCRIFAHNTIGDFIICQKLAIWFSSIPFIGIHPVKLFEV
jgi:hypothetical protein